MTDGMSPKFWWLFSFMLLMIAVADFHQHWDYWAVACAFLAIDCLFEAHK